MEPATARNPTSPARWPRIALAIALGSAHAGCSKLDSMRRRDERPPAVLGTLRDESGPGATALASRAEAPPVVREVEGAGPAVIVQRDPAPPKPVNLLPPVEAEPQPSPRLASSTVPNASRLIAPTERRAEAATKPADAARLVAEARASLDAMASYQVALHRLERINGRLEPEEDVIVGIRREPRAVRLSWPSGPHKGREVLYRSDEPGGQMHVNMADSAIPVPRLSLPPDSPMVMRNSRHPVTEAGFDSIIASLEEALKAPGGRGLEDAGMETPSPLDRPHQCLVRITPNGDRWRAYLDPQTHLPAMVRCDAANGDLQELYVFRDVRPNLAELASADAFDPDARWGPPRGLLGRLSRSNNAPTPR